MQISFTLPLQLAWDRMKRALFAPFDPVKWLVVGFAAWLAHLANGGGSAPPGGQWQARSSPEEALRGISHFVNDVLLGSMWGMVLLYLGIVFLLVVVLLLWISSRGKFVFLDAVVHDRAAIVEPWKSFASQGNSLFLWRLVFAIVVIVALLFGVGAPFGLASLVGSGDRGPLFLLALLVAILVALLIAVPAAYIALFLECFVVPIMYRDRISTTAAWRKFLPLLRRHTADFVLFGLFVLALAIAVLIVLAAAGCLTCCVGFLVMAIPYVGTVVLLPITYTYRAFGPEFLAQYGMEYSVWLLPEPPVMPPPSTPYPETSPRN